MRIIHLWRYLPVVAWLGVAATGVWSFLELNGMTDPTGEIELKSTFDRAFVYLFLLLVPFGLWMAKKEYLKTKDEIPRADAETEKQRLLRIRQKAAKQNLTNQRPLHKETKKEVLDILAHLKTAGVIAGSEIDETALLEICQTHQIESGDEVVSMLAVYSESHGDFSNALFSIEQIEKTEIDIRYMIKGFARLAGCAADLGDITITAPNTKGSPWKVQFSVAGTRQNIEFEYFSKYTSQSLLSELADAFNPESPYALTYFEPIFMITTLDDTEIAELNKKLDPPNAFERLPAIKNAE